MARHQHYVPRKYLRPWSNDEQIWCLRAGKVFQSNLMGVAQERDFYKLERLTDEDFALVHAIAITPLKNIHLRQECEALLQTYAVMFKTEKVIADARFTAMFDDHLATVDDNIITELEAEFFHFLDLANQSNLRFLEDLKCASRFYHGLMLQYFRTNKIRSNMLRDMPPRHSVRVKKIWPLFRTLYSIITSFHIVCRDTPFNSAILHSHPDAEFITSDQPIINLSAVDLDYNATPETAEFYYPISPSKALLFSERRECKYFDQPILSAQDTSDLNQMIYRSSHSQTFARRSHLLRQFA